MVTQFLEKYLKHIKYVGTRRLGSTKACWMDRDGKSWLSLAEQSTPPNTLTVVYFSKSVGSRHPCSVCSVYPLLLPEDCVVPSAGADNGFPASSQLPIEYSTD